MQPQKCSKKNLYAVILAGGIGSRFWPFSRELEPKQFINIVGKYSLLQNTIRRLKGLIESDKIYVISNAIYTFELKKQLSDFNIPQSNIILEPGGKNTAPAIGVCARLIYLKDKEAVLSVFPADHYISGINEFKNCITEAFFCALEDYLVTLGVRPTSPSTGYGYIRVNLKSVGCKSKFAFYKVEKFLEKPDILKAKNYANKGNYFWNSGIFVWKASVFLAELSKYIPSLHRQLNKINAAGDIKRIWHKIKPISVDYGIMECSRNIALIPARFYWSDLGSWSSLSGILSSDSKGNVFQSDGIDLNSNGLHVISRSRRFIGTIGLKDVIIADTPDALLVCAKDKAQEVRGIVEKLKLSNRNEHKVHLTDKRPWGAYTVLQTGRGFKIKLVEIEPYKRLSLQKHNKRAEHWVIVSGRAKVTCGSDIKYINRNQSIYISKGQIHRIENPEPYVLKIVEVQTGDYLQEDDIIRLDDDFKRFVRV